MDTAQSHTLVLPGLNDAALKPSQLMGQALFNNLLIAGINRPTLQSFFLAQYNKETSSGSEENG